jgi:hypothetical protein
VREHSRAILGDVFVEQDASLNVCNRTDIQAYFGDATAMGHCGDSPE